MPGVEPKDGSCRHKTFLIIRQVAPLHTNPARIQVVHRRPIAHGRDGQGLASYQTRWRCKADGTGAGSTRLYRALRPLGPRMVAPNEQYFGASDVEFNLERSDRSACQTRIARSIAEINHRVGFEPERMLTFGEQQPPPEGVPGDGFKTQVAHGFPFDDMNRKWSIVCEFRSTRSSHVPGDPLNAPGASHLNTPRCALRVSHGGNPNKSKQPVARGRLCVV